jgi:hypothetical protein
MRILFISACLVFTVCVNAEHLLAKENFVEAVKASVGKKSLSPKAQSAKESKGNGKVQDAAAFNRWLVDFIVKMIIEQPSVVPVNTGKHEEKKQSELMINQKDRATIESAANLIAFVKAVSPSTEKSRASTRAEHISLLEKRLRIASQKKYSTDAPFEQQVRRPMDAEICRALLNFVDSIAKQKKAASSQQPSLDRDELFRRRLVIRLAEYNSYLGCNSELGNKIKRTLLNEGRASAVIQSGPVTAAWSSRNRIPLTEQSSEKKNEGPEAYLPRMDSGVKDQGPSSRASFELPWFKDPRS